MDGAKDRGDDFVELCLDHTQALRACMEANPDYYAPVMVEDEEEEEGAAAEGQEA